MSLPAMTSTHAVKILDLDDVVPHPKNPRRDLGDLTELTASIKADGVRNAVHVMVDVDGGRYVLVQGHRRREASILAGHKTIPAVVRADLKSDADALVEMAVENLLRADLTPLEEAVLFEQLQIAGLKPTAIAKRTGRKKATVDARLALMTLPEAARDAVHGAQLSLDDAAALVEFADDEKTVARLTAAAGTSNFRWSLQEARNQREYAARRKANTAVLEAAGVPIVNKPKYYWEHQLYRLVQVEGVDGDHDAVEEARRATHAACPHHAAYLQDTGSITYICEQPDVHRSASGSEAPGSVASTGDPEADAAGAAERAAARERAEQDARDCETAAGIRREFVRDTVSGKRGLLSPASCTAIALAVAEALLGEDYIGGSDGLEDYLDVTLPDEPEKGANGEVRREHDDACLALFRDELGRRGGHAALLALLAATREQGFDQPHAWTPHRLEPASADRAYLALLWELGYEATEWEAARVAAADTAALEQPADVDEDGDG